MNLIQTAETRTDEPRLCESTQAMAQEIRMPILPDDYTDRPIMDKDDPMQVSLAWGGCMEKQEGSDAE